MRLSAHDGKFPKVLVEGYENAIFVSGNHEYGFISRVVVPIAAPHDIVP
jgi:hypothetical protein